MLKFKSLKDKYSFLELKNNESKYIFLDLEFNRFTNNTKFFEITSIGAVKCDKDFKNINCFHSYVLPISYEKRKHNKSKKIFYNISNKKIPTNGQSFSKVISDFSRWLGDEDIEIFTWGTSDYSVLMSNIGALNLKDKFTYIAKRIRNIQPEVSGYVKVLGNPINNTISLENIKKIFFYNKEVAHNGLLDAIDLMKVFKKYKNNAPINEDALYELSYVYKNVSSNIFKEIEKHEKNKKLSLNLKNRVLIKNPNNEIIGEAINTLNHCDFEFKNDNPKFLLKDEKILFDKFDIIDNSVSFNTTKDNFYISIKKDKLNIELSNEDKKENLEILTKYLPDNLKNMLKREIIFSSNIYKDIELRNIDMGKATLLNYFAQNGYMNFSNNIKKIAILDNKLFVTRKKDTNLNSVYRYDSSFYIKTQKNHFELSLNYKCPYKHIKVQEDFKITKTNESKAIIQEILKFNEPKKNDNKPKLANMNEKAKNIILKMASKQYLKTKRGKQVFVNSDKLRFLKGRSIGYLNLENTTFLIINGKNPYIVLRESDTERIYEFRISKNKATINDIKELVKLYNKEKPRAIKIYNLNSLNSDLLNKLKNTKAFILNNNYTYHISKEYINISKIIKNEHKYQNEEYNINNFIVQININKDSNLSIKLLDKRNPKKVFIKGISSKKIKTDELHILLEYINKENDHNNIKIEYFSRNLLNLLRACRNRKLIVSNNSFLDLDIQSEIFKIKREAIKNQIFMDAKECCIEIFSSSQSIFLNLCDKNNSFSYSIENTKINKAHFEKLIKVVKKHKINSWINVFEINKNIRNSAWRVVNNSSNKNTLSLYFNNDYIKAGEKKYFYRNTPLSIKKIDSDKLSLQIGVENSKLYDIEINKKNKMFIDDLINNTLLYEEQHA